MSDRPRRSGSRIFLDLGGVRNLAEVRLNGKGLGTVWTAPWRVDITAAAKPAENILEISVTNLWPNRLIGDAALPAEQRRTKTNIEFKKDQPLLESGLLGPVRIMVNYEKDLRFDVPHDSYRYAVGSCPCLSVTGR